MNEVETRAHESAREAGGVMPVAGDFRTPRVRVGVVLGGVVVAFAVAGLKRQMIEVRAPVAVDGRAGGGAAARPSGAG